MSRLGWSLAVLLALGLLAAAPIYARYRHDLDSAWERVRTGASVAETVMRSSFPKMLVA